MLASQTKKVEKTSFLIGTQSLKGDNQIHQVEYEDCSKPLKATVRISEAILKVCKK